MFSRRQKEWLKKLIPPTALTLYHHLQRLFYKVKLAYYRITLRGNTYYCPFCKNTFSRFLPDGKNLPVLNQYCVIGGGYRTNCICPGCGSKDRERLLYCYLKQKTGIFSEKPLHVLHIAPEANLKKVLKQHPQLNYINADLNPGAADVQMDITDIPYSDAFFDIILCNHVLEHIPNDGLAIRQLYRVLKPGGQAILQVPFAEALEHTIENPAITHPADRETQFGQFDHVRIYGHDYLNRLQNAGFTIAVFTAANLQNEPDIKKMSLIENEKIFVGYKNSSGG